MTKGTIFDIQPFSVYDGPGIRTTVFFKGCNLRCKWCHNPESWEMGPQLSYYPDKCIGCGACFAVCPTGAHVMAEEKHLILREQCTLCCSCSDSCYAGALEISGREITAEALVQRIADEKAYYDSSGGGVTFSGGDPLLQADFLKEVLQGCKEMGIHTAVDTAGCVPFPVFEKVLEGTDLFLFDLKAFEEKTHIALTGQPNRLILENLEKLVRMGKDVTVRVPCIKGANLQDMPQIAAFLHRIGVEQAELLAYHKLGESKMHALGLEAVYYEVPTPQEMKSIQTLFYCNQVKAIYKE